MTSREKQELIELINLRLDAEALVRAIGFHTDKLRVLGRSLKTPCFVHRDERFATLLIMPDKHTCKCMVSTCPAHAESTLIHLYALWLGVEELDAALAAAEATGLELTDGRFASLTEEWMSEAGRLQADGQKDEARALYGRAARLGPRNVTVLLAAGKAAEDSGDSKGALAHYLRAAHAAQATGQPDEGLRILREEALRVAPDRREVLEEVAWVFAALDRAEEGAAILTSAADSASNRAEARALVEKAREIAPHSAAVELKQARLMAQDGEAEQAITMFGALAQRMLDSGDAATAREALQGAVAAAPDRGDLLEILLEAAGRDDSLGAVADFLGELAGSRDEAPQLLLPAARARAEAEGSAAARPLYQRALDALTAREDAEAVRSLYEELVEDTADGDHWREGFGEWLAARGEIQIAIAQFRARTESVSDSREDRLEAVRLLERMAEIDTFAPEIRQSLARARLQVGQTEEAEADFLEAARLYEEQQKDAESLEVLAGLVEALPLSEKGVQAQVNLHVGDGRIAEAIDCLRSVSKRRAEAGANVTNISIFQRWMELQPDEESVQEDLARAFEDAGNSTDAVDTWRELAESRIMLEDYEGASRALAEAIRIRPEDLDLRMERLDVLDVVGDDTIYRSEALAFLKRASTASETSRAEKVIRRLHEKFPDDLATAERMADVEIRSGKAQEGCARLKSVAEAMAAKGEVTAAARLLQRVLEIEPADSQTRERLVTLLEESGSSDEVMAALLSLAQLQFQQGDQTGGLDCLARYEARAGAEWEPLKASSELLLANGLGDRALSTIRNLVKTSSAPDESLIAACEFGLGIAAADRGLAEKLLSLYEKSDKKEQAMRSGMRLAGILQNLGDQKGAALVLESLKERHPSAREPRLELARLHAESSRKIEAKAEFAAVAAILRRESRLTEAKEFYERAVALDPEDVETGLEYAACLEELNQREKAVEEVRRLAGIAGRRKDTALATNLYDRLFELAPDDLAARGDYVEYLQSQGDAEKAASEALQLAHRWFREEDAPKGIDWARRASAFLPDSSEMASQAAGVLYQNKCMQEAAGLLAEAAQRHRGAGRSHEAEELIREGLARGEDQPELLAESAEMALSSGQEEGAIRTLRMLAAVHDKEGRTREAEEVWRRILELAPESIADHEELIGILQRQGPSRKADALDALKRLVAFYLSKDMGADAITCYQRQLEIDPHLMEVRAELAHAYFEADQYKEATQQFLILAAAYRQSGKVKLAIDYLGKVIELDPQNLDALKTQVELTLAEGRMAEFADYSLRLASLQESAGRGEDAIESLRKVVDSDRENLDVRPILASYLVKAGEVDEGVAIYLETARRHLAKKKKAKAVEVLERVQSLSNPGVPALEGLGELYQACGENQRALAALRKVGEKLRAASDAGALERLCARLVPLLEKGDKPDEAVEWQLDLARVQVSQGMVEKARALLEKIGEAQPEDQAFHESAATIWAENGIPELAAQAYLTLARMLMKSKDWSEARTWCRKAVEGRTREIAGREMLAECLRQLGETQEACQVLLQLADLYEDSLQPAGAAEVLARVVEMQPEEPTHLERLADALDKMGRHDEMAGTLRILAQVHEKRGDLEKAIENLKRLKTLRPDDTRVRSSYIRLHRNLGREKAILEDMVYLAGLQVQRGDREVAFATLHEAAELDPHWPDARERLLSMCLEDGKDTEAVEAALALVETYLHLGAYREASIALQRVKRLAETEPRHRLAQANIHMAQNTRGMALREYEEAAKLFADKGDLVGRTTTIARIIEIDPHNLDVRRELIECLRAQDKYTAATEAQRQLAEAYANRGLWDLAETEYRDIVSLDPADHAAWQALFAAHLQIGDERDLIPDYIRASQVRLLAGDVNDAIHHLAKVIALDPRNIEAREKYIEAYKLVGRESELCDDYLRLADLYVESGRIDDGIAMYNHVMSVDPGNTVVRDRLTETQARLRPSTKGQKPTPVKPPLPPPAPLAELPSPPPKMPKSLRKGVAADFLADEIENLEKDDHNEALEQVINSYRDILAINAQNANVRIKLADLYLQQNERDKALEELRAASEIFLNKGELLPCIAVCERILKVMPTDQKVRNRLKQAFNKRDAFKALESAILFSDEGEGEETAGDR